MRSCPAPLLERFQLLCETPSDINEHLETLRKYASECEHVTEIGTRGSISTTALLAAQPADLITWDINPFAIVSQPNADLLGMAGRTKFQPRCGDSLKITIEPTDMLFIDSLHTFKQLDAELARHCDPENPPYSGGPVRKYILLHDTSTFGRVGEDGKAPGLIRAIEWFQSCYAFPLWTLKEERRQNNGLVVLERVDTR